MNLHGPHSSRLDKTFSLALLTEILGQLAGAEFAALVAGDAGIDACERREEAAAGAGNALHNLVTGEIAELQLAAGIKGHHRAFTGAQPTAALAGQAQNWRVVAHLDEIRSAVGIQRDVRSGGDARLAKGNLPRDRAAAQPAVVKEPGIALGAGIALNPGRLVQCLAIGVGRRGGAQSALQATENQDE